MILKPGNPWGAIRGKLSLNPEQALAMFGFIMREDAQGVIFRQYRYLDDNLKPHIGTFISNYIPATNPQTELQQAHRAKMRSAVAHWQSLTNEQKKAWDKKARGRPLSGFNLHNSKWIKSH